MRRRDSRDSRAPRAALALAALGLAGLAGCGAPHPSISNGSVSACYRAIPVATAAVHDKTAHVIGVHRVSAAKVRDRLPPAAQAQLSADLGSSVCAVAFKGHFAPGQVAMAPPGVAGTYAVVLVTSQHLDLLRSVVLDHLPRTLGRRVL